MLLCGLVCLVVYRNLPIIRNSMRLDSVLPCSLVRNVCLPRSSSSWTNCLLTRCGFRLTCFTCFTRCKGNLLGCGFFLCGVFVCGFLLLLFGFLCVCCFPLLLACLSSFTDWCIAHRQQSREQKKIAHRAQTCVTFCCIAESMFS